MRYSMEIASQRWTKQQDEGLGSGIAMQEDPLQSNCCFQEAFGQENTLDSLASIPSYAGLEFGTSG